MKKVLALLLTVCICLMTFTACNIQGSPSQSPDPTSTPETGLYIPEKIKVPIDGAMEEVDIIWTQNSCTFTIDKTAFLFTYDEATGSMDVSVTYNETAQTFDDLCVFDQQGRVTSVNVNGTCMFSFSYENNEMKVLSCAGKEDFVPTTVIADWNERKVQMPPFDNPDNVMYFTEYGDLCGGEDTTLYTYGYDEYGNIKSVSLYSSSFELIYGTEPMTNTWQRCPLKFISVWCFGLSMATFAMDMMCSSLVINNNIS